MKCEVRFAWSSSAVVTSHSGRAGAYAIGEASGTLSATGKPVRFAAALPASAPWRSAASSEYSPEIAPAVN